MKKGDIILVPFPFTDLMGNKKRPALVLISSPEDVTVCFITTKFERKSISDIVVKPTFGNGLKKDSVIRLNKIATLDKEIVLGRLGTLEESVVKEINKNLIRILQLQK
ncbi:transcriptional modulator of MazE/toxin, MazF [Tangfeifania diversioriginum]|uniref:Transcriptional modulator of MazE/toxin, MazF n=1 Tax=Tangfeifania diversioriginum TaxID=1168035 RepID=A0A1M6CVQ9_9BACT|nr:type II toxin-antitoxin system PemK/MazF family toxin [Tangfeifania diversioriginum]SHI65049.1 transcriptional modulator of MazE/toxin, MazF [Tangfeifania diversioriginum]